MWKQFVDWSEVWSIFIPLAVLLFYKKQPKIHQIVIVYLLIALACNFSADIIWKRNRLGLTLPFDNNNPIYNVHSIIRLILFSLYFIRLKQPFLVIVKRIIPVLFIVFVFINFYYFEDFFKRSISNRLHAVEAGLLLFYCLQYYIYTLHQEGVNYLSLSSFWIVTGLSVFVVISFPIYLYYPYLLKEYIQFTKEIWLIQKISFLIFCLFTAKAFYKPSNE